MAWTFKQASTARELLKILKQYESHSPERMDDCLFIISQKERETQEGRGDSYADSDRELHGVVRDSEGLTLVFIKDK